MNTLRHLLIAIVALVLIAALVFLYDKTQAVDLGERNEIAAQLDALREIDGRWDVDVLRERTEFDANQMAAPKRAAAAKKALATLSAVVPRAGSAALSEGLGGLKTAILEKADLVEKYKIESTSAKTALRAVLSGAAALAAQAGELGTGDTRQKAVHQALNQLAAAAQQYYWQGKAAPGSIETAAGEVRKLATGMSEGARDQARAIDGAIQALLKHKPVEQQLFTKTSFLSSGPRLDKLTFSFNRELEATLQIKELFRVYLLAYAAALLIGVGYLGVRLKAANESLERRVVERTRELSEALRHLKESEAQLIQSEKMSSLGQMVAGVAHEINTPLAYVKNSLGTVNDRLAQITAAIEHSDRLLALLRAGKTAPPGALNQQFAQTHAQLGQLKAQRVLSELGGLVNDGLYGIGEMAEIVGNLKDFSRLDRSKVTSFNLNDGLTSSLGLARHMLKSIKVNRQFGEIPAITCAPSQINQVFLNLITNAAQALAPANGEITLTTRAEGGAVVVEVADNGKGIPPEVLPKIFDPFFTTKEAGKGTGLGLSISYKIVQQHGGRIEVASEVGKGTKFTVSLPAKPPADAELAA